jgi:opacity protein-like surface antigen
MAKGYAPDTTGEVEVQIVKFKVKGATPDLIDSLKNVAAALSGSAAAAAAPRALRSVNAPGATGAFGDGTAQAEYAEEDHEQTIEQVAEPAARSRRPAAKRKIRSLKLIEDITFDGKTTSLQDYMDQYNFEDKTLRKYLGIAGWFKEQGPVEDITVDHVYTAYRSLGWTDLPDNPSQPLNDAANQRSMKWLSAGEKSGSYHINHVGEKKLATFRKAA